MVRIVLVFSSFFFFLNIACGHAQSSQSQSISAGRQIGQTVGGMAGGATGNFVSGGNLAATTAGSEIGRQIGGIAGEQAARTITGNVPALENDESRKSSDNEEKPEEAGKKISPLLNLK